MPRNRGGLSSGPDKQRGQALLFVTVAALVMLLAMLTMFSMGQLTTEKMKLQNTADAAAYSAAVAQARDYNFTAYLNRGMIANDVAVAQLVGLASWGRNYYDTFHTLTNRVDSNYSWVLRGPLYPLWSVSHGVAKGASSGLKTAFEGAARTFVPLLLGINIGFANAEKIYHYGTALTVAQTLGVDDRFNSILQGTVGFDLSAITNYIRFGNTYNVIRLNDPSASLSLLGVAGYAYNTYQWANFTSDRNPLGPWGSERVDNSFTERYCGSGWLSFGSDWICRLPNSLGGRSWSYRTHTQIDTITHPADDGTFDGPKKDRMSGVVMATTDDFTKDRSKNWWLPMLVDPILLVGPPGYAPMGWFLKMLFHDGSTKLADDRETNPLTGGARGRKADSWNHRWEASDSTNMLAIATIPICGIPFWGCINIPVMPLMSGGSGALGDDASGTASAGPNSGDISKIFTALRTYRDVKDIAQATDTEHQNLSSPPLVVEVEKQTKTISTSATVTTNSSGGGNLGIGRTAGATDPAGCGVGSVGRNAPRVTAAFGSGNLDVGDGSAANCMRALAKAEAYFSRPANLYPRGDGLAEYGSLYSPYWQARLLPNSSAEQSASLILHGLTDFRSFGAGASSTASGMLDLAR